MDQASATLDGNDIARATLLKRRDDLRQHLQDTQQALQQCDQQRAHITEVLLRQQGAIQVLDEMLAETPPETPA